MDSFTLLKLASQLSNFARFDALGDQFKQLMLDPSKADRFQNVWQQREALKNRYRGMPPPGRMPDPNWQVVVQSPMDLGGTRVPGYVQVDDVTGGVNRWSEGPKRLAQRGINVPDVSEIPQGRYSMGEAAHRAWLANRTGKGRIRPAAHGYAQLEAALALANRHAPDLRALQRARTSGVDTMSMLKSWRRMRQKHDFNLDRAFRRFSAPRSNALKFLLNSAKYLRL